MSTIIKTLKNWLHIVFIQIIVYFSTRFTYCTIYIGKSSNWARLYDATTGLKFILILLEAVLFIYLRCFMFPYYLHHHIPFAAFFSNMNNIQPWRCSQQQISQVSCTRLYRQLNLLLILNSVSENSKKWNRFMSPQYSTKILGSSLGLSQLRQSLR